MQILDIVLYGKDEKVRRLALRPGHLNIITGSSQTGKSALNKIVEYCLGRNECLVPTGVITENISWYALRLLFPHTQVFVARRAPEYGYKSSSDTYIETGSDVAIPSKAALVSNSDPANLNTFLTRLMRISPNSNEPSGNDTRDALEATLRHALLLAFQQQFEVANPDFLFHRQGDKFMPQAMIDTFPYFLGAVAEDRLAKVNLLRGAKRELSRIEKRMRETSALQGQGLTRGLTLLAEAEDAGLIATGSKPSNVVALQEALNPVLSWVPQTAPAVPGDVLERLEDERSQLRADYRALQDQLRAARNCADGQKGFTFEAQEQKARLAFIGLYPSQDETVCPICASQLPEPPPRVLDLTSSLDKISRQLNTVSGEQPRLREFIDGIEERLSEMRQQLSDNRTAIGSVAAQQGNLQQQRSLDTNVFRVVGRISLYLESLTDTGPTALPADALEEAQQRVKDLEEELARTDVDEMLPSILNIISQRVKLFAQELGLEFSDAPIRFDLRSLDVIADTEQGPVPLKRMGSGANWVGYHLAVHFALHSWFVQKDRPVPRFLFLDQPTQVYYPQDRDVDGSLEALDQDDRRAVDRMFHWLLTKTQSLSPNFQVIVTDHLDIAEPWFKDQVVERWRGDQKLIPLSWL